MAMAMTMMMIFSYVRYQSEHVGRKSFRAAHDIYWGCLDCERQPMLGALERPPSSVRSTALYHAEHAGRKSSRVIASDDGDDDADSFRARV